MTCLPLLPDLLASTATLAAEAVLAVDDLHTILAVCATALLQVAGAAGAEQL